MAKRRTSGRGDHGFRPSLERVERRELLAVNVTNTGDSGPGSLRDAILQVNAGAVADDTILFKISSSIGFGPSFIFLQSELPTITHRAIIDGFSQAGASPNDQVVTDDASLQVVLYQASETDFRGLVFGPGSDGSRERGLNLIRFGLDAIEINANRVQVSGNYIGIDYAGITPSQPVGRNGVAIVGGTGNTVGGSTLAERNLITGLPLDGVVVAGGSGNVVSGNFLGVDRSGGFVFDADGSPTPGNGRNGVRIVGGSGHVVGGFGTHERNVISGNRANGVALEGGSGHLVVGNLIGLQSDGSTILANVLDGVLVAGATGSTIGSTADGGRNVISGNGQNGVETRSTSSPSATVVSGNYLGLDATGLFAKPNAFDGVDAGGANDRIGPGNVIAGNARFGAYFPQGGSNGSLVGSTVGLGASGDPVPNQAGGVLDFGAGTTIGGTGVGDRNVISGNRGDGVRLGANGSVLGNLIGLNPSGTAAVPNSGDGVLVVGSTGATIDGATIAGNGGSGVRIGTDESRSLSGATVVRSTIGLAVDGRTAVPNALSGILVEDALATTLGGATASTGNLISGNGRDGVTIFLSGASAPALLVGGNTIGLDATGAVAVPNQGNGVLLIEAGRTTIGSAGAFNVISGNRGDGIAVSGSTGATILGNRIGTSSDGLQLIPNEGDGVDLTNVANNSVGPGNSIAGNGGIGLRISGGNATGNVVFGNLFGLTPGGQSLPATGAVGVLIEAATGNSIGVPGLPNVLSNQSAEAPLTSVGVHLLNASGNVVQSNLVGTDPTGTIDRGNNIGILVEGGSNNLIGGSTAALGNVVSGNDVANVEIRGVGASGNLVSHNVIGLAAGGINRLQGQHINDPDLVPTDPNRFTDPRSRIGLLIVDSGSNQAIANVVSDDRVGIEFSGAAAGNVLTLNTIGLNAAGGVLGPGQGIDATGNSYGVFVNDAPRNLIGLPGQGNTISGNQLVGVEILGPGASGTLIRGNAIDRNGDGVFIQGASNTLIQANVIDANRGNGVLIYLATSTGNQVLSNRIARQAGAGVVLANTGRSNVVGRSGAGANSFAANRQGNVRVVVGSGPVGSSITTLRKQSKPPVRRPKAATKPKRAK